MSVWGSAKARRVLAALLKIGWSVKRELRGSHRILARDGWPDYVFASTTARKLARRCWRASPNTRAYSRVTFKAQTSGHSFLFVPQLALGNVSRGC